MGIFDWLFGKDKKDIKSSDLDSHLLDKEFSYHDEYTFLKSLKSKFVNENMDFDNNHIFNFNHRSGDVKFPSVNWQEPLSSEINHFFDCIQHKYKCLTGINHTKEVISILQKASIK